MIYSLSLLHLLLAVIAGIIASPLIGSVMPVTLVVAWGVWLATAVVLYVTAVRGGNTEPPFVICITAGGMLLGYTLLREPPCTRPLPDDTTAYVEGRVAEAVEWRQSDVIFDARTNVYGAFTLHDVRVRFPGKRFRAIAEPIRCTLVSAKPVPLQRGDSIGVEADWQRYRPPGNPGQFDVAAYYRAEGIRYKITAKSGLLRWRPPVNPSYALRLRRSLDRLRERFARVLFAEGAFRSESIIARRMLLGVRDPLPNDMVELFACTGTFHIIAISGLHIGIVWGFWWGVTWLTGMPGRVRGTVILPVMWLYACMVGFRASVIRAMLMFSMLALAPLCRRPNRAAPALIAAAMVYTIGWPRQVQETGTLLTYLSVVALMAGAPLIDRVFCRFAWYRGPAVYDLEHRHYRFAHNAVRYVLRIVGTSCAIWMVTWPVTVTRNHLLTPASLCANILLIPAAGVVLILGFLTLMVSLVSETAAHILNYGTLAFLKLILLYLSAMAKLPFGYFSMSALTTGALFWYYCALGISYYWGRSRWCSPKPVLMRTRVVGICALTAWCFFGGSVMRSKTGPEPLKLVVLDVGLGDAAVIHGPDGAAILVDGGVSFGPWSQGVRTVIPYLRAAGVNSLDAVICSHFDRDHAGGLIDVLRIFKVKAVYAPPVCEANPIADQLQACARSRNITWHTWYAGESNIWDGLALSALHPPAAITNWIDEARAWGDNTWSLVLRADWHGRSFLLTGDATVASEAMQNHCRESMQSDIIKLGHHGSASSSSGRYLDRVQPLSAVLSVGPNQFGLPTDVVLRRLEVRHIPVMRTDWHGAVQYEITSNRITISTYREMSKQECTK